jgi:DNA-binding transcriptional ArsR family regulator
MILADRALRQALAGLTDSEFERAVLRVPEHRLIVAMAQSVSPRMVEVSLPAAGAPTGRPLEGEDRRMVTWTLEHPDDERFEDEIARRRARVLRLMGEAVRGGAVPSVENLAEALTVSPSTIRRDLAFLREQGHAIDTRGQRRAG